MDILTNPLLNSFFGDNKKKNKNQIYLQHYIKSLCDYYSNIAYNVYKWEGLPEGMTSIRLEQMLFESGYFLATTHKAVGPIALVPELLKKNYNKEYVSFRINPEGLESEEKDIDNAVLVKNNYNLVSTLDLIMVDLIRMGEIETTSKMNLDWQKVGAIFRTNKAEELSVRNIINQFMDYDMTVKADKNFIESKENLVVGLVPVPYIADKLDQAYMIRESRLLTKLGINNNNAFKRERNTVPEAEANKQQIGASINALLETRKLGAELMNKMFEWNVSVDINPSLIQLAETTNEPEEEGGEFE